ncbi:Cocaine esterase [Kordia antarctica]|uniref:Cocaine esterase n=1 Tax=Kordia antarctica TaxID=1218801 RepID=A0A7L4ZDI4_9FLAO|nr:CocE/NonD family hydrolase [Kordia antarctica]QHI34745.1 Cocaine esterase [Kordia antarctica]
MSFRFLIIIFLVFFFTNSYSQEKQFPKITFETEAELAQKMESLAIELQKSYKSESRNDSLLKVIRFQLIQKKYKSAISVIELLEKYYHDKYPAYKEYYGKRNLVYAKAKLKAENNSLSFEEAYVQELKQYIENIKVELPGHLDYFFNFSIMDEAENFEKLIKNQKDMQSEDEAYLIFRTYMNAKLHKETSNLVSRSIKEYDENKYIIKDSVSVVNGNVVIPIRIVRKRSVKGKQPTLLMFSIYASDFSIELAKSIANKGYVSVIANTRGKWFSENELHPFEDDGKDAYNVIDWISKQPWSNGKVGMFGGSYLGFSQWAAAKKLHPALKTIVPQVAVGVGVDYPMYNNVFMSYMLRWIHLVENTKLIDREDFGNDEKWDKAHSNWFTSGKSFRALDSIEGRPNKTFQRWLDHPSRDEFWQNMVADKEDFSNINIPILTTTGYFDDDQLGAMFYFKEHHAYHKNPEHYLVIGPYDHSGAAGNPAVLLKNYEIDSVAQISITELVYDWFDYILKGKEKPTLLKDKINYQVMETNTWKHTSSLNEVSVKHQTYYLSNKKEGDYYKLETTEEASNNYVQQEIDFSDRKKSHDFIIFDTLKIADTLLNSNNGLTFISDPLEKETIMSGSFSGELSVKINKKDMDYTLLLYELKADGTYFYLSNHLQRASYSESREHRELLKPNEKTILKFKDTYFTSKKLEKGSRLILIVNINKNLEWEINYGTGKEVSRETIKDAEKPLVVKWFTDSFIKIPIEK